MTLCRGSLAARARASASGGGFQRTFSDKGLEAQQMRFVEPFVGPALLLGDSESLVSGSVVIARRLGAVMPLGPLALE